MAPVIRRTLLLAALVALIPASGAQGAITGSQVSAPSSPAFSLYDAEAPGTFAVTGNTSGGNPGTDQVDLRCFYGAGSANSLTLASGVATQPDGTFSLPSTGLSGIKDRACRLRAVPAGTTPADLSPFSGPVLATGERSLSRIASGPNLGRLYDFYVFGQQLGAGADYSSLGKCGVEDGYLFDSNLALTTTTFFCNDWFDDFEDFTGGFGSSTRSELRVDGADAYPPTLAEKINPAAPGFPSLAQTFSLDASAGDLTVHESEVIVRCPSAAYPPSASSCPYFVSTGVRDDRTIEQGSDGHLVTITDAYTSVDGGQHSLDLLPQNTQKFTAGTSDVAYRFPGEAAPSTHAAGDVVAFPAQAPGAVYLQKQGAPDGDQASGRGAIVFDRPASPATFNGADANASAFYFHQTATVPDGCTTSFRFAYVQAYSQTEVDSLAQTALGRFAAPIPGCSGSASPGTPDLPPQPAGDAPTGLRAAALRRCKHRRTTRARKRCRRHALTLPV